MKDDIRRFRWICKQNRMTRRDAKKRQATKMTSSAQAVHSLEGQRFVTAALGYAGELHLHFGDDPEARWVLNTCGTRWMLAADQRTLRSRKKPSPRLEAEITSLLRGRLVIQTGVVNDASKTLLVMFDNSSWLVISPSADDAAQHEVPYWELFLPTNQVVEARPLGRISLKRADQPAA